MIFKSWKLDNFQEINQIKITEKLWLVHDWSFWFIVSVTCCSVVVVFVCVAVVHCLRVCVSIFLLCWDFSRSKALLTVLYVNESPAEPREAFFLPRLNFFSESNGRRTEQPGGVRQISSAAAAIKKFCIQTGRVFAYITIN